MSGLPFAASLLSSAALTVVVCACSSSSSSATATDAGAGDGAADVTTDPIADWSCLGNVKETAPTAATVPFDFTAVDPFTNKGVKGAVVKTCAFADADCKSPFETMTTDDNGKVSFKSLPTGTAGFDGYFDVRVGTEVANLNFEGHPLFTSFSNYGRTQYGDSQLATVLQTAESKIELDPTRGLVTFQALDCTAFPKGGTTCRDTGCRAYVAGGVSFSLDVQDPKIVLGYINNTNGKVAISTKATSTSPLLGIGGFINVPTGPVTLTAKVAATGQTIGTYKTFVRAGSISAMVATPK